MSELPPVARALDRLSVSYRLFVHAGPVHSLGQAARERNQLPDQVIRSIVFRVGKDEYLMVLIAGDRQISWPALRRYLGQSRLTLATEEEVHAATGYQRGAVAPFGLPQPMRILKRTIEFVTHNLEEAAFLGDRESFCRPSRRAHLRRSGNHAAAAARSPEYGVYGVACKMRGVSEGSVGGKESGVFTKEAGVRV